MTLKHITILNYKNIAEARLSFSPGINCLIGNNGQGKTNVLDAIYCLSHCRSFTGVNDASVIKHDEPFMMLQGTYDRRDQEEEITLSQQRGRRKVMRRNGKDYKRLSQHVGLLPLVMVSPMDWDLIRGSGEERRRLMDQIISQTNAEYLDALIRYTKALEQRNALIRNEVDDPLLYETVEHTLQVAGQVIHAAREQWLAEFAPIFMSYYQAVAGENETVRLTYKTHLADGKTMQDVLRENRRRDFAVGYTSRGVHRDDIELWLGDYSMRKTGSQGQCKTYSIALRLAQFDFLKRNTAITPILLLDDIFDKLDARRVERIVGVVSQADTFGQIFITDTNRTHLDHIMSRAAAGGYALFAVEQGRCTLITGAREDVPS